MKKYDDFKNSWRRRIHKRGRAVSHIGLQYEQEKVKSFYQRYNLHLTSKQKHHQLIETTIFRDIDTVRQRFPQHLTNLLRFKLVTDHIIAAPKSVKEHGLFPS